MKKKNTTKKQSVVYIVQCIRYEATWMEICATRESAEKLMESLCRRWDFLYPEHFYIFSKRVRK